MDFTILAVVLLLCGGVPLRNKIYKSTKREKRKILGKIRKTIIRGECMMKQNLYKNA